MTRAMARDRPSPYVKGVAFFIVARGLVPRDLHRHEVCSPDYKQVRIRRSCSTEPGASDGEGNPLASACSNLRGPSPYVKGGVFFIVARGPVTATLNYL